MIPNWTARVTYQPDESKRREAEVSELFADLLGSTYIRALLDDEDKQRIKDALRSAYTAGRVEYAVYGVGRKG